MKIISGGQTGVDRAALDVALELGLPCGGYCTKGRRAEDGRIPDRCPLVELPSSDYPSSARANIKAAGATLILVAREKDLRGGTALTERICQQQMALGNHRYAWALLGNDYTATAVGYILSDFISDGVSVLNVAGPRESKSPGIYRLAYNLLKAVLAPYSATKFCRASPAPLSDFQAAYSSARDWAAAP